MSGRVKHRNSRSSPRSIDPVTKFMRLLHSTRTLAVGYSKARQAARINDIPKIVTALFENPVYTRLLTGIGFPKSLDDFKLGLRASNIGPAAEFIWTASVLSAHSKQLSYFVKARDQFTKQFLTGDYVNASETLDAIERDHGLSLWLLANRLQLIQIQNGLQAQKDFFENILSTENISIFAALLSYYFSMRSEENVSLASLYSEATSIIEGAIGDYAILHVMPYYMCCIKNPSTPIYFEQSQPLIDRFQTLVSMSLLDLARSNNIEVNHVIASFRMIEGAGDFRVSQILNLVDKIPNPDWGSTLEKFDLYTQGLYENVIDAESFDLELQARTHLLTETSISNGCSKSILVKSVKAISNLLMASDYHRSSVELQKLAVVSGPTHVALQISAFLQRGHDHINVAEYSELDRLSALNSPIGNPWTARIIESMAGGVTVMPLLNEVRPNSTSLALQRCICLIDDVFAESIQVLQIPEHRMQMYSGHVAMTRKDFREAAIYFERASETSNSFSGAVTRSYLFKALCALGRVTDALALTVDDYLTNPDSYRFYSLEEFTQTLETHSEIQYSSNHIILLHILSRQAHPRWEQELSDAFENFLLANAVSRPRDIYKMVDGLGHARVVYILRNICVPRILDDTILFEDLEEIEEERIAICRSLMILDPNNERAYADEIRSSVRSMQIADLLNKVETSKIYVDEEGIKQSLNDSLRDLVARYQVLIKSPVMNYQAEKISQKISQLLDDRAHSEIGKLNLPSSEREGLFNTIIKLFGNQFALDPAHGLDTHLSTTIRHGAFEGHVRNPLAAADLLCLSDEKRKIYLLPKRWQNRFAEQPEVLKLLHRLLSRFTEKVEEIITYFLTDALRVKGESEHPKGLFSYVMSKDERHALLESVTAMSDYDSILSLLFSAFWQKTEASLIRIREELQSALQRPIIAAYGTLITAVESGLSPVDSAELLDTIVQSRTAFQAAVESISGWFYRPVDLRRSPFEIDLAIGVSLKQIENCYRKIGPRIGPNVSTPFCGWLLDGTVEILFILLQNFVRHAGLARDAMSASIRITHRQSEVLVEFENSLSPEINLVERSAIASEAMRKYEQDTALKMARKEGGSGLSKIWRILEFDLRRSHRLCLEVTSDRLFRTSIWFNDNEVFEC